MPLWRIGNYRDFLEARKAMLAAEANRRMEDLLGQGKTLFLVSHSENDLRRFGTRGLYLRGGELVMDSSMEEVLKTYRQDQGS